MIIIGTVAEIGDVLADRFIGFVLGMEITPHTLLPLSIRERSMTTNRSDHGDDWTGSRQDERIDQEGCV